MSQMQPRSSDALTPKFIKTELAQYVIRQNFDGMNRSGRIPINDLVVVLLDETIEETASGIIIPVEIVERMDLAAESGILVAVGAGAFKWSADRRRPFEGIPPRPGDRVQIDRYAGQLIVGQDKQKYRLLPDRQIGAILVDSEVKSQ